MGIGVEGHDQDNIAAKLVKVVLEGVLNKVLPLVIEMLSVCVQSSNLPLLLLQEGFDLPEEVHGARGDSLAVVNAFPRIVCFRSTKHELVIDRFTGFSQVHSPCPEVRSSKWDLIKEVEFRFALTCMKP